VRSANDPTSPALRTIHGSVTAAAASRNGANAPAQCKSFGRERHATQPTIGRSTIGAALTSSEAPYKRPR